MKREFDEKEKRDAEAAEIERRRGLTDAQIMAEDSGAFKNTKVCDTAFALCFWYYRD